MSEREQLLYNLAYAQWSVQEIQQGQTCNIYMNILVVTTFNNKLDEAYHRFRETYNGTISIKNL